MRARAAVISRLGWRKFTFELIPMAVGIPQVLTVAGDIIATRVSPQDSPQHGDCFPSE